jgi:hypothetical protein
MAMTKGAFEAARQEGVVGISANVPAMADIAHELEVIERPDPALLKPMLLVARDTRRGRAFNHDETLPEHQGDAWTNAFYSVRDLGREDTGTADRARLVRVARRIGAPALTEISFAGWRNTVTHARAFGHALTTGQRPLILPPRRNNAQKFVDFLTSGFDSRGSGLRAVNRLRTTDPPFTFRYRDTGTRPRN